MQGFTSDWFSPHILSWQKMFSYIEWDSLAAHTVIEIGSFEGRSAQWILHNLIQNAESKLHCVDVFPDAEQQDSYYQRFVGNVLKDPYGHKVTAHRGPSFDFLVQFLAEGKRADFVYVDGSHRASDVLEDLALSFRALRPGGLIICDDYLGGSAGNIVLQTPKIAVDAITNIYRDQIEILPGQQLYQFAFRKIRERDLDDPSSRGLGGVA